MTRTDATPGSDPWQAWVGRSERRLETLAPTPLLAWRATLDRPVEAHAGAELPPLAHWLYFLPQTPASELGPDGHARRGGFLPPVPLPRRMWAGGRLRFERPVCVGATIERVSTIASVATKHGRSGELVFVTVRHELRAEGQMLLQEEHDIVYREAPQAGATVAVPPMAPVDSRFQRTVEPDPVLLFRYSALTFNGHRIHYDRSYVTDVEGYPGLVVHGPLIATLLVDLVLRQWPGRRLRHFSFTAVSPLFDVASFSLHGRPEGTDCVALWAANAQGQLAMQARAELA